MTAAVAVVIPNKVRDLDIEVASFSVCHFERSEKSMTGRELTTTFIC